jgi:hypothetical protein
MQESNGPVTVDRYNFNRILCRAAHYAGVESRLNCGCCSWQAQGDGACGDAVLAMPEGMPITGTDVLAAHTGGADLEAHKIRKHRECAYAFEAMNMEAYGRLGAGLMRSSTGSRASAAA